jgi:signal transduction histidine kinase
LAYWRTACRANVKVTTLAGPDSVAIVVRDHGIGIPSGQLHGSVFDWFCEGPGRPCKTMDTGSGLAIAKCVAEHHGGTIILRDPAGL